MLTYEGDREHDMGKVVQFSVFFFTFLFFIHKTDILTAKTLLKIFINQVKPGGAFR